MELEIDLVVKEGRRFVAPPFLSQIRFCIVPDIDIIKIRYYWTKVRTHEWIWKK